MGRFRIVGALKVSKRVPCISAVHTRSSLLRGNSCIVTLDILGNTQNLKTFYFLHDEAVALAETPLSVAFGAYVKKPSVPKVAGATKTTF